MLGKKKTQDVQFYTEVMEATQALEGGRKSMYDPDEIEEEQRERAMRAKVTFWDSQRYVLKLFFQGLRPEVSRDFEYFPRLLELLANVPDLEEIKSWEVIPVCMPYVHESYKG